MGENREDESGALSEIKDYGIYQRGRDVSPQIPHHRFVHFHQTRKEKSMNCRGRSNDTEDRGYNNGKIRK